MSTRIPTPYDAAASYRDFGQELLRMIQSGQITPERANQLKADVYAATKLGNTDQGQQAMNAAIGAARDAMPMQGYDPAAMYSNITSQLSNAVSSGRMTAQQAQALQAPLFEATKVGNTAPGYAQMTSAYNRAISAIRNASPAQPQGGLTQAQQPQEVVRPPYVALQGAGGIGQSVNPVTPPQEIMVTPQRMPEIATLPPSPSYYDPGGPVMPQPPMPVSQPQELPVAPTQPDMPERHSEYGIPLWMQLGAGPERDAAYAQYMKGQGGGMQPKGIGGMLNALKKMQLPQGVGGMTPQGSPNALTIARGPIPLDQQGPALGGGIGAFLGRPGDTLQGGGMMPRLAEMLKPKQPQGSFVDTMPKAIVDDNFRFGETTQQMPQNAQAMALGGLMAKYRGGMC